MNKSPLPLDLIDVKAVADEIALSADWAVDDWLAGAADPRAEALVEAHAALTAALATLRRCFPAACPAMEDTDA